MLTVLRYGLDAAVLSALSAGVHYGYRMLRGYSALTAKERLAAEQVRRLDGLLAIAQVERDTDRRLWDAALELDGSS